ncbi:uncharacterized protein FOMMEDRAFT_156948 [Fomitiporia mediterranea MF3/22]|uniref:uncharacterized protein n=1 Tax=Fomitiporia mediterranea (strain MF3/22) TaxID=694068 RepID=UPI00044079B4|nr:uncharacterized protein FOMMEDRAFT_156948 [Fomitiporia mediterranea MF3/22]EJD01819.1 hypothetical protein FOMMEDRAFT_156948 [Fomitiporia mediterranea MF3/22]
MSSTHHGHDREDSQSKSTFGRFKDKVLRKGDNHNSEREHDSDRNTKKRGHDHADGQQPPPDAIEAQCRKCDKEHGGKKIKIVYFDPKTQMPIRPTPEPRQEFCEECGLPWPMDKKYNDRMTDKIRRRLAKSDYHKDEYALCDYHAGYSDEADKDRDLDDDDESGNKRALLIGIRYKGMEKELEKTEDDIENMKKFLNEHHYKKIDILMEDWNRYRHPTKEDIQRYMERLVEDAKDGSASKLFPSTDSGHGKQVVDRGKHDEVDGKDEGIVPVDYKVLPEGKEFLIDDEMHEILATVNKKIHLTAVFDSCHSGSALDLPYEALIRRDSRDREFVDIYSAKTKRKRSSKHKANIILWSGCDDKGTSKETRASGGVMSRAFIESNRYLHNTSKTGDYTYAELLQFIRDKVRKHHQVPQLSTLQDFDPNKAIVHI